MNGRTPWPWFILGALLLASCTSQILELPLPGQTGDSTSVSGGPGANPGYDSNGVSNTGPTSTAVDPPVQTAGAFLVCRADIEAMPDPAMAMGGCKLMKEDTKYDAWRAEFTASADLVPDDETESFAPEILSAMNVDPIEDDFDAWHWRVTYPRAAPLMQFRLQIVGRNGAVETVRAYLKGQEWYPVDGKEAVLKLAVSLTSKESLVSTKAESKGEQFFMVPPTLKATLTKGTTDGVVMMFSGLKPVKFGPCRFVPVGYTEVTADGVVPSGPGKRSAPGETAVYFEMVDDCPAVAPGQIRRMEEVELKVERPKDSTSEVVVDVSLPALQQRMLKRTRGDDDEED